MKADFFFFYKNKEQKNYIYIYIYTCVCVFVLANDNNPDLNESEYFWMKPQKKVQLTIITIIKILVNAFCENFTSLFHLQISLFKQIYVFTVKTDISCLVTSSQHKTHIHRHYFLKGHIKYVFAGSVWL